MVRTISFAFATLACNACSGTLQNHPVTLAEITSKAPANGIIHYNLAVHIDTFQLTEIRKDGKITHRIGAAPDSDLKPCNAQVYTRETVRPDYSRPWLISYKPGLLEKYDLAVALHDGVIASVNVKSDPDRGATFKIADILGSEISDRLRAPNRQLRVWTTVPKSLQSRAWLPQCFLFKQSRASRSCFGAGLEFCAGGRVSSFKGCHGFVATGKMG